MALSLGQILQQRYKVVKNIGEGGFGNVYLAKDIKAGQYFAIKEQFPKSTEQKNQCFFETRTLMQLSHPGLTKVVNFFEEANAFYIVMEFIEGKDLFSVLMSSTKDLSEKQVISWAIQVCEILEYIHSQSPCIVVRDLKPSNIMIDRSGKIRLIDFGIAKELFSSDHTPTVIQGWGTPGYSPPEQSLGGTSPSSDIYAF